MRCSNPHCNRGIGPIAYRRGWFSKAIVSNCRLPDGIDVGAGHIYWTNMGVPNANDGSVGRADFDGENRKIIVPLGRT